MSPYAVKLAVLIALGAIGFAAAIRAGDLHPMRFIRSLLRFFGGLYGLFQPLLLLAGICALWYWLKPNQTQILTMILIVLVGIWWNTRKDTQESSSLTFDAEYKIGRKTRNGVDWDPEWIRFEPIIARSSGEADSKMRSDLHQRYGADVSIVTRLVVVSKA